MTVELELIGNEFDIEMIGSGCSAVPNGCLQYLALRNIPTPIAEQLFRVDIENGDSYDPRAELRKLQFDRCLQAGQFGEQRVVTTRRRSRRDGAH